MGALTAMAGTSLLRRRIARQMRRIVPLERLSAAEVASIVAHRREVEPAAAVEVPTGEARQEIMTSPRILYFLRDVRVYAHYGLPVTRSGYFLEDSVTKRVTLEKRISSGRLLRDYRLRRVDEPICCVKDHPNVYHFWRETIAPLALLREPEVLALDSLLVTVTTDMEPWRQQVIEDALPPNARLERVDRGSLLSAPMVVLPSRYRSVVFSPAVVSHLRGSAARLAPVGGSAQVRAGSTEGGSLFVSRRATRWRRPLNEPDLFPRLRDLGVDVIQPEFMSPGERAAAFSEASLVVGQSGAGLTNVLHSQPGTRVLEIRPSPGYGEYFPGLSASLGLEHSVIDLGVAEPDADMRLPVDEIERRVRELQQRVRNGAGLRETAAAD